MRMHLTSSILKQKSKQLEINNASPTQDISELYYLTLKDMLDFLFEVNLNKITTKAVEVLESDLRTIINGIRLVLESSSHDFVVERQYLEKVYIKIAGFSSLTDDSLARTTALVEVRNLLSEAVQAWPSTRSGKSIFDVYISYNTSIKTEAEEIAVHLRDEGFNVWIDAWMLKPSDNWKPIAQKALEQTRTVLILIGPSGIGPRGQTEELEIILSTFHENIIPVLLPNASPDLFPDSLEKYVYSDFRSGITDFEAQRNLISVIRGGRHKPLGPPAFPGTQPEPSSGTITTAIKPGDTLFSIAMKYHTTVETILKLNPHIKNSNLIFVGEGLKIPTSNIPGEKSSTSQGETPIPVPGPPPTSSPGVPGEYSERYDQAEKPTPSNLDRTEGAEKPGQNLTKNTRAEGQVTEKGSISDSHKDVRVLNAGFALSSAFGKKSLIKPDDRLYANENYVLLVDIGPMWRNLRSLVTNNEKAVFPESYLPADQEGYLVRIVFVSEDFTPHLTSAEMWVPRMQGQSYPYRNGKQASAPEPVGLEVHTPGLEDNQSERRAYGRLCLYYKGQLIQSAQVSAGIAREEYLKLDEPHRIEVDYVLTSNLSDISGRFGNRRAQIQAGEESRPVSVGLTLNDDGSGRHRILATYHIDSRKESSFPPIWTPYDAQAAQAKLTEFREAMLKCYQGLDQNFGKPRNAFTYDMQDLAILGSQLRKLALPMDDMEDTEEYKSPIIWQREFLDELKTATVIQIARTGPANYVFPWALIYEYGMPGPEYKVCPIIEEWDANGIRKNDKPGMACIHKDEDWHQENIVCPYGFWGLKHIIEQPTGAIKNPAKRAYSDVSVRILTGKDICFGVGITHDIDQVARDLHISELVKDMKAHLEPPQPADDRQSAFNMLRAPEIVYFLCHGETDSRQTPYLSIGKHVKNPDYGISPDILDDWG